MIHDFFSFYAVVSKCEEWKEKAFLCSAPGDIATRVTRLAISWPISKNLAIFEICWPWKKNAWPFCI